MPFIMVEFHQHHGPSIYVRTPVMSNGTQCYMVCIHLHMYIIVANHIIDHALLNALQWQSTPEVILKPDQRSVIVKFECGHLPTRFVKSICFQMLLFALIVCQRSVLLVVVHGCGHFAIILQFPTHGGKGSKQRENITGQTM